MQNKSTYIGILVLLLFSACNKETAPDCFKKGGEEVTLTRYTEKFTTIILYTDIDVELVQSQETRVEVSGGKNLLPKVITSVKDKILEIDNTNGCNFVRGYKKKISIKIFTPYVRTLRNKGVGDISMTSSYVQDSLQVFAESVGDIKINGEFDELVTNSGSHGDVYVKGKANKFYIYCAGTNYVKAEELLSNYVYVNAYGLGDCFVNLSQTSLFEYTIRSNGNIYYIGNPQQINNFGNSEAKGKLIQK